MRIQDTAGCPAYSAAIDWPTGLCLPLIGQGRQERTCSQVLGIPASASMKYKRGGATVVRFSAAPRADQSILMKVFGQGLRGVLRNSMTRASARSNTSRALLITSMSF